MLVVSRLQSPASTPYPFAPVTWLSLMTSVCDEPPMHLTWPSIDMLSSVSVAATLALNVTAGEAMTTEYIPAPLIGAPTMVTV